MKKQFLGTTALVAAGALVSSVANAEEGIKLGLGGYMNNHFGVTSQDSEGNNDGDTDFGATVMRSDGEVWFVGETTLDNGITFGANIQLESFTTGDQIDENYAYITGSFGRVNLGSENSAAYLMHYAAPSVGAPINSGWLTTFVDPDGAGGGGFRTPRVSTYLDVGNDENIITYFSPRFSGFQVGVSYAPAVVGTGEGLNGQVDQDEEFHDGFSVGANYVETIGPVDLAVSGGYRFAKGPDNDGAAGNRAGKDNDLKQYSVGANVGWAGFTFGGSWARESGGRATEGNSYDAGVSYGTGPWAVGLTYFHSKTHGPDGQSRDDKLDAVSGGVSYQVGPGIEASGSLMYVNWNGGNNTDSDGIAGIVGMKYRF